ncbi:hypothetical protein SAMN05444355_11636 [Flavobacterium frigoris]|uniref:Uncharacterized protein n=1 Tax=Flavobacterium frigoris TaxID=229204 RepID=A0A1H9QFL6_FLAFI|nr:hypothetical protein SAMN05444355_11636 [Flavobacterium frigoris]
MKKLVLSLNVIYDSLDNISVFRLVAVFCLVSLILTFFILSFQFIWLTSI